MYTMRYEKTPKNKFSAKSVVICKGYVSDLCRFL